MVVEEDLDKEYAGIMGYEAIRQAAVELALGKDDKNKLVCMCVLKSVIEDILEMANGVFLYVCSC